jgi:ribonuclease HII
MTRERRLQLPTLEFEQYLWKGGFSFIAGIDEAGRGALAGPVAGAAVILPNEVNLSGRLNRVRDSKLMTAGEREHWTPRIKEAAIAWGLGFASPEEIDGLGISRATKLAVIRALDTLSPAPDYLLTDFLLFPEITLPQSALIKGDQRSLSVAAASVLAKTSRDELMRKLDVEYPGYELYRHKGYGTQAHRAAVMRLGRCAIHRQSFTIRPL